MSEEMRPVTAGLDAGRARDLKWLKNAEHYGEWERFDEETGEREPIWLLKSKSSPEARFYAVGKGLVSKHAHMVTATYWGYGTGYLQVVDPSEIFLQIACRAEVLAGGAPDDHRARGVDTTYVTPPAGGDADA